MITILELDTTRTYERKNCRICPLRAEKTKRGEHLPLFSTTYRGISKLDLATYEGYVLMCLVLPDWLCLR